MKMMASYLNMGGDNDKDNDDDDDGDDDDDDDNADQLPEHRRCTSLCRQRRGLVWEYSRGTEKSGCLICQMKQVENHCFLDPVTTCRT